MSTLSNSINAQLTAKAVVGVFTEAQFVVTLTILAE